MGNGLASTADDRLVVAAQKVADWFTNQAARHREAVTGRFKSLDDARIADALNYEAMARDLNDAIDDVRNRR